MEHFGRDTGELAVVREDTLENMGYDLDSIFEFFSGKAVAAIATDGGFVYLFETIEDAKRAVGEFYSVVGEEVA